MKSIITCFCLQFHWTPAQQRARQNETVRTTISNLSRVLTTDVSQFTWRFVGFFFFQFSLDFSSICRIIFERFTEKSMWRWKMMTSFPWANSNFYEMLQLFWIKRHREQYRIILFGVLWWIERVPCRNVIDPFVINSIEFFVRPLPNDLDHPPAPIMLITIWVLLYRKFTLANILMKMPSSKWEFEFFQWLTNKIIFSLWKW